MANVYDESITMMTHDEDSEASQSWSSLSDDALQNEQNFKLPPRPQLHEPQYPASNPSRHQMTQGIPRPPSALRQPQAHSSTPPQPHGFNERGDLPDKNFLNQKLENMHEKAEQFLNCSDEDDDSLNDDTNLSSFMDEDDVSFLYQSPELQDYGSWIDAATEKVPSPYQTFPIPPIHDENAMKDYLELKDIWELQLSLKRDRLAEFVSKNCIQPGVHKSSCYDPNDYSHLVVSKQVSQLFLDIQPPKHPMELEVKLGPYIPDYYPSVGDMDAFLKVLEPSVKEVGIGLNELDEPTLAQSDPAILDLQLRSLAKMRSSMAVRVKSLDDPASHPELVDKWIKDISDLHKSKPSPSVHYSKPMPDIDSLLQEWSPEVEEVIKGLKLPEPDLSTDLGSYVDIVCGLLDIPVYKSRIQSLHVLFSLYAASKEFNGGFGMDGMDSFNLDRDKNDSASGGGTRQTDDDEVDTLKII